MENLEMKQEPPIHERRSDDSYRATVQIDRI